MKNNIFKVMGLALVLGAVLTGCGNSAGKDSSATTESAAVNSPVSDSQSEELSESEAENETAAESGNESESDPAMAETDLVVCFGDDGSHSLCIFMIMRLQQLLQGM